MAKMTVSSKTQMLKDFVLVQQGFMSCMYFAGKWHIPYQEFYRIAYGVQLTNESCQKRAFDNDVNQKTPCPQCGSTGIKKIKCTCGFVFCLRCAKICSRCGTLCCPLCPDTFGICEDCRIDDMIESSQQFLRDLGLADD